MNEINITLTAEREVASILTWYRHRTPATAMKFLDPLEAVYRDILEYPTRYPYFRSRYRYHKLDGFDYIVLYRMQGAEPLVECVNHTSPFQSLLEAAAGLTREEIPMLLNAIYGMVLALLSPWLLWRGVRTGRYRQDLWPKLSGKLKIKTHRDKPGGSSQMCVWFHGVSVGEIHLLITLIAAYRQRHPHHRIVVSSTTDTGLREARAKFEQVVPWPFDFTWAVANALDTIRPSLVVLAEAEMWPNYLRACERRDIPVVVVNARMSPRSYRRYQYVARLARHFLFSRVRAIGVQDESYAERFRALGVPQVTVTGSIKYDGALRQRDPHSKLAALLPPGRVLVAGSTHAPEEAIVLAAFRTLRTEFAELTLVLVPRHPDRFDEVAKLVAASGLPFVRRSENKVLERGILLLDTIGELSDAWSLATVGYVGGTLDGVRGGQSMIEPAGFGVPTVFGPHVWNFRDAARRLIDANGAVMVNDADEVAPALAKILADDALRTAMGSAARQLVEAQQGATERTLELLDAALIVSARAA